MFPKRKPPTAAHRDMIDLAALTWPVTYVWEVRAPWGDTQQTLTVEVPALEGKLAATERLGAHLWSVCTAPAVSGFVSLTGMGYVAWKQGGIASVAPVVPHYGDQPALPSSRENTPQLVLLTGHADKAGRRRFFLPGAPRMWSANGLLTRGGFEALIPHARGMMLGLATPSLGSGIEWLLVYPGEVEPNVDNLTGTCFRRVTHVRVCHHTDKAPAPSSGSLGA
jgi:hypothetical protein